MNRRPKISFCGAVGSFTYLAAQKQYGNNVDYMGFPSFSQVFKSVAVGEVDFGVVPIENTIAGSIYQHYDLLESFGVFVTGEIVMRIKHHLLTKKGMEVGGLKKVLSHPKALEQCQKFFVEHPQIEAVACSDTATAAKMALNSDGSVGAIAGIHAANIFDLSVCKKHLEDHEANYTRFFCLEKQQSNEGEKCCLVAILKHECGSLHKMLTALTNNNLNLTKIDSRPVRGRPFEYLFYLDIELSKGGMLKKSEVEHSLHSVEGEVKILGMYNRSKKWTVS